MTPEQLVNLINSGKFQLIQTVNSQASSVVSQQENHRTLNDITNKSNNSRFDKNSTPISDNQESGQGLTQLRPVSLTSTDNLLDPLVSAISPFNNTNIQDNSNGNVDLQDDRYEPIPLSPHSFVFSQSDETEDGFSSFITTNSITTSTTSTPIATTSTTLNQTTTTSTKLNQTTTTSITSNPIVTISTTSTPIATTSHSTILVKKRGNYKSRHNLIKNLYNNNEDDALNLNHQANEDEQEIEIIAYLKELGDKNVLKKTEDIPRYKEQMARTKELRRKIRSKELRIENLSAEDKDLVKRKQKNEKLSKSLNNRIYIDVRRETVEKFFGETVRSILQIEKAPLSKTSLDVLCTKVFLYLYYQGITTYKDASSQVGSSHWLDLYIISCDL